MHAFLITGATRDQRLAYIGKKQTDNNVSKFDCLRLIPIEESIGIAAVRDFRRQLPLSPYDSPKKLGIIENANTMTIEAQNALLKTLEEPPPNTVLFLECPIADALLATIVSRCTIVNLGQEKSSKEQTDAVSQCIEMLEQIVKLPVGKRMVMVDEIAKTREDAKAWVELAIVASRHAMLYRYGVKPEETVPKSNQSSFQFSVFSFQFLRSLLTARSQLSANVTPKLVLDNVFLSL